MGQYERSTRVDVSLDRTWDFHSRVSGLEALTPSWMGLQIESVLGPDGDSWPDILEEGTEIAVSIRPFDVGPRQHWRSKIVERNRSDEVAYFRDEMIDGPFDRWRHTHAFYADGPGTVIRDTVEYDVPGGQFGALLEPLSLPVFGRMFKYRHQRSRELLGDFERSETPEL